MARVKVKDKKPRKRKPKDYERCHNCGGSSSILADDWFIKKCWCNEEDGVLSHEMYELFGDID